MVDVKGAATCLSVLSHADSLRRVVNSSSKHQKVAKWIHLGREWEPVTMTTATNISERHCETLGLPGPFCQRPSCRSQRPTLRLDRGRESTGHTSELYIMTSEGEEAE